jgi:hypothetical protein
LGSSNICAHFSASPKLCWWVWGDCAAAGPAVESAKLNATQNGEINREGFMSCGFLVNDYCFGNSNVAPFGTRYSSTWPETEKSALA